jgi:uncharacterized membrane protein YkvA (DUF1232 family)
MRSSDRSSALGIYRGLREDLAAPNLALLKTEVRAHYDRLLVTQVRNELIAVDLADLLCVRLEGLLAMAHLLTADARSQVVGAARYFISPTDAVPDDQSCTGLDDDVEVFNHVVSELGRPDLLITE